MTESILAHMHQVPLCAAKESLRHGTQDHKLNVHIAMVFPAAREPPLENQICIYVAQLATSDVILPHAHGEPQTYLILSGTILLFLGNPCGDSIDWQDPITISSGKSYTIQATVFHAILNTGDDNAVLLFSDRPQSERRATYTTNLPPLLAARARLGPQ